MEDVEQLAFIGVETLDLNVKDRVRINVDVIILFFLCGELLLVFVFDLHHFSLDFRIVVKGFELL